MSRCLVPVTLAGLFVVASCGSSNSGKSGNTECKPAAAAQPLNLQGIRIPSTSPSTPGNTAPGTGTGIPAVPGPTDEAPAANDCNKTQPGDLGDVPNTPAIPGMPTQPGNQPGFPGAGTPRTPSLNTGNIIGRWELNSDFCEDGTQSPEMQQKFQMMLSGNYNQSLTITETSMDEFAWLRFETGNGPNEAMMCTMMRKSTYSRGANGFRISTPATNFEDAGGLTPCNLPSLPSETKDNVRITVQGGVLVLELPRGTGCNGKTRIQLFSSSNPN